MLIATIGQNQRCVKGQGLPLNSSAVNSAAAVNGINMLWFLLYFD